MHQAKALANSRRMLRQELQESTEQIIQMEDLLAKSSEAFTDQRRQLALLQFENKRLGLHVMDLRQQVPSEQYIHVKHDAIDR